MWCREESPIVCDCLQAADDCAACGIPLLVIHSWTGLQYTFREDDLYFGHFDRLVERAHNSGIRIAFENLEGAEYLDALMARYQDCEAVGFCWDSGHELCYNGGKDMMALYGEKLCHTHFNDNLGSRGEAITWFDDLHYTMGDGIVDWKNVMKRIRNTGYDGIIMCELTRLGREGYAPYETYSRMTTEEFARFALERARAVVTL